MSDVINIQVEELIEHTNINVEVCEEQIHINVQEITETVNLIVQEVGIKGNDGIDGLGADEAEDIRNRLTEIENEEHLRFDSLPSLQ